MKQKKKTERKFTPVRTIKHYLQVIEGHGDKVLFRYYADAACREIVDMTYAEFVANVRTQAAAFEALGLAGKRVAVVGETSYKWLSTHLATIACGGVIIPMDKEVAFEEMLGLLAVGEADVVVYSKAFNDKFASVTSHDTLRTFIPMEPGSAVLAHGYIAYDKLMEEGKNYPDYQFPESENINQLAEMLFTSGTTGTSKCVMLSQKNMLSVVNTACEAVEFFPDDTIVSVLPVHHTYELCCMLAGMNYGMTIGINDSLKHVLKSITTFRPTGLVLVPLFVETMHKRIWDKIAQQGKTKKVKFAIRLTRFLRMFGIDLRRKLFKEIIDGFGGRLERIVCGGAALNPATAKSFDDFGITIMEGYGITECSPLISVNPYYALKTGSVGPACPCCEVRIDGTTVNDKGLAEGEIIVKGDNVMLGYYRNEEANANAFTEEGWYRTGDVGYMDKDGYIFITGRMKSVIVLDNGKNVFPEEVEEYIGRIAGIVESVVLGRKNEEGSVVLTAIVVPDYDFYKDKSPEEIEAKIKEDIRTMNKKLAAFKQVKTVEIREEPFEKTTSRKIKRHLVK